MAKTRVGDRKHGRLKHLLQPAVMPLKPDLVIIIFLKVKLAP